MDCIVAGGARPSILATADNCNALLGLRRDPWRTADARAWLRPTPRLADGQVTPVVLPTGSDAEHNASVKNVRRSNSVHHILAADTSPLLPLLRQ